MQTENEMPGAAPVPPASSSRWSRLAAFRGRGKEMTGQAIVEFSIVSVAFFMIVFGTVDFGRAIYMYSQLHSAVQEGARFAKSEPADTVGIENRVIEYASAFNLAPEDIDVECFKNGSPHPCYSCSQVQVTARTEFSAITQDFLGIRPISLEAISTVATE